MTRLNRMHSALALSAVAGLIAACDSALFTNDAGESNDERRISRWCDDARECGTEGESCEYNLQQAFDAAGACRDGLVAYMDCASEYCDGECECNASSACSSTLESYSACISSAAAGSSSGSSSGRSSSGGSSGSTTGVLGSCTNANACIEIVSGPTTAFRSQCEGEGDSVFSAGRCGSNSGGPTCRGARLTAVGQAYIGNVYWYPSVCPNTDTYTTCVTDLGGDPAPVSNHCRH